ncbi:hypothetical protein Dda3937_04416 [Dickeya dadantii 3937]|uniref:Uncharacterized protein n=1 Tax=Dickeya dadantii (strain 3937) TaxID=198628 RepID=E0SJS9_DICD3|nr:hypothetical protein Dda3937_04416 [Dickeya dadantii 3937]
MNPDGFTLAGQRKRCSILRCKMVCRCAVPSAFAFAVRAARDVITRPIPGARPTGQRKRCSKTLPAFLSRRGTGFRSIHAAHPAKSLTSAQF